MGAWGYRPFDNDSALDWLDVIEKPMVRQILAALKRVKANKRGWNYHEGIAAAALLLDHTRGNHYPDLSYRAIQDGVFPAAILAIETIQKDQSWIESWNDPFGMVATLRKLHRALATRRTIELKRQEKVKARIVSASGRHVRKRRAA